jgi:hypothetical protein
MEKSNYSSEDYRLVNAIEGSLHRALWGEVIPSMRGIILKWKPGDEKAWVIFYHTGEITEAIESHYSSIMAEVDADYWGKKIICDYKVVRCDWPAKVPTNDNFIIYLRKEPFIDPV